MQTPVYRKLKGYVFDPGFSCTLEHRLTNEVVYKIRWEKLRPGPIGEYVEVVDYDPTKRLLYQPVNLDDPFILAEQGLPLSEGDPCFHQQQVYAVVMSVIEKFEKALCRKIIFSRLVETPNGQSPYRNEYVPRLRIYPHGMRQQNAFYSPQKIALVFGYFKAADQWVGNNIPNTSIFACLAPDIVMHECTHALLDSIHPYLNKDTSPDMLAFHEGFADIIALLYRFTFRHVVEEQIRNSRGDFYSPENMLGDLAIQFGHAVSGNRRALRSYLMETGPDGKSRIIEPNPSKYANTDEVHDRGAILVAAVFNAFARLYRYKVADLIRLASDGSGILRPGAIPEDLVKRLASEACEIAEKLMMICIRAIEYCPPADLDFGDYLRALITADVEYNPEDEEDMRYALIEAFRNWGLVPIDLTTYSASSLLWQSLDECNHDNPLLIKFQQAINRIFNEDGSGKVARYIDQVLRLNDREKIFEGINKLSATVHEMFNHKFEFYETGMEKLLGMCFDEIEFKFQDNNDKQVILKSVARDKFQVYRCRPVILTNPQTGKNNKQLLITFLQKISVNLKASPYEGYFPNDEYEFCGGATLIIDLANFKIKYAVVKSVMSSNRLKRQLDYKLISSGDNNAALLMHDKEPFASIHRHD